MSDAQITPDNKSKERSYNLWDLFLVYFHECVEIFVSILIIRIAMDKSVDFYRILQASMVIGFVTFMLEHYNSKFKSNVKQGITFSVGSQMMSQFMDT